MGAKRRWVWGMAALVAIIAAVTTFGWMTINTAEAKAGGWVAAVVLVVLGVVAAISHFAMGSIDGQPRGLRYLITGRGLASFISAAIAGLAAMSLMFPLLDPPTATKADIDGARAAINSRLDEQLGVVQSTRTVLIGLPGGWGEDGCLAVYRFQVKDGAVFVDLVEKDGEMSDYSMVASIVETNDAAMLHATIERSTESDEPGDAVVFTYSQRGKERLTWLNRSQQGVGGLELGRCPLSG